jgi:protein ImuB
MLWIALHLPDLPLEACAQASASPEPQAIINDAQVLVCNPPARARGIRPGMSASAACALVPQLVCRPRDLAAETAALHMLAVWAQQFTSNISLEPPHGLLLDIEGSLRLFGGIRPILETIRRGLDDMGFSAFIGCAPTAAAALLLARGHDARIVNCKRALETAIAELPLAVLECNAHTLQTLRAAGIKCVGDLMALPRDGVARRFGQPLLDGIDRALGRLPAPRRFFTPPARFNAKLDLAWPVTQSEALLFAAKRLLTQLCGFLSARNGGVQRLKLSLLHEGRAATTVEIGLVAPTRDAAHLIMLARERLSVTAPPAPVQGLRLEAGEILALAEESLHLFPDRVNAQGEWEKLIERLRARLGADAVHGLDTCAGHRPERKWRTAEPATRRAAANRAPRPLWLLEQPRPLTGTAELPQYENGPLALVAGPERIESDWWDNDDIKRDYFIARSKQQATLWVYRERNRPGGWYLHGVFG